MPKNSSGKIRIIAGRWKRTPIPVLDAEGLRPTGDRQRETLFNWLTHLIEDFSDKTALDMFAGSGALSLEFLSRGGRSCTCYDTNRAACRLIAETAKRLESEALHVKCADSLKASETEGVYDVIFIDPPFALHLQEQALKKASALLRPGGYIYVESPEEISDDRLAPLKLESVRRLKTGPHFMLLAVKKES